MREAVVVVREDVRGRRAAGGVRRGGRGGAARTRRPARCEPLRGYLLERAARVHGAGGLRVPGRVAADAERQGGPQGAAAAGGGRGAAGGYAAPRDRERSRPSPTVWQEVLRVERVGLHDNFFDLGGHSLLLDAGAGQAAAPLEREIPIVDLFRFPTVATLGRHLDGADAGPAPRPRPIESCRPAPAPRAAQTPARGGGTLVP